MADIIKATFRGYENLQRDMKAERAADQKVLLSALKVEGFRLRQVLARQIMLGHAGGDYFKPLSMIRQKMGRTKKPLRRLTVALKYDARTHPGEVHIGFTGPKVSASWMRIAAKQQAGFDTPVTEEKRAEFRSWGQSFKGRWTKTGRSGGMMMNENKSAKFFFLRKSTMMLRTPARPIIGPFWDAEHNQAWANIRKNFKRKAAGQRI